MKPDPRLKAPEPSTPSATMAATPLIPAPQSHSDPSVHELTMRISALETQNEQLQRKLEWVSNAITSMKEGTTEGFNAFREGLQEAMTQAATQHAEEVAVLADQPLAAPALEEHAVSYPDAVSAEAEAAPASSASVAAASETVAEAPTKIEETPKTEKNSRPNRSNK